MPTEAHHSIGLVERYHGPVRRAYQIVHQEVPDLSKEMALQMAFRAVNDTVGPDGLVPTLLVYGAYPRLSSMSSPAESITARAAAIQLAMKAVQKLRAEREVADALNTRNGPDTTPVHELSIGDEVLTFREVTKDRGMWKGPYKLVAMHDETCTIDQGNGIMIDLRSTSVRPYIRDPDPPSPASEAPGVVVWAWSWC